MIITPEAVTKIENLMENANLTADYAVRVAVQPGGCSGLRYQIFFDDRNLEGDCVYTTDNDKVSVVVDKTSEPYLQGATLNYHDAIDRQGFVVDNPNAHGACACGDSFY